MSLSLRLLILILTVVFVMLAVGAFGAINNAREIVSREIESSAKHTLQLLSAAVISAQAENARASQQILLHHLQAIDKTRHLKIAVRHPDGTVILPASQAQKNNPTRVPTWLFRLIAPTPTEYRRRLATPGAAPTEIVIVPNPDDKIRELWRETRTIASLILLFTVFCVILITWLVKRSLRPLIEISSGLSVIQAGNYQARLPAFNLPDLNTLSVRFNHMAEVLEEQQRENRRLSKRTLDIAENERRHLARELHDELGQSISAIKAVAVSLKQKSEAENKAAGSIIDISDHIYSVVRGMMNRLRPVVLDELGLVTALERLVDDWNSHHEDSFCALHLEDLLGELSESTKIHLYRIVQEALTNISKHASATEVSVRLISSSKGKIALSIRDNGKGFKPSTKHTGMGLAGIRERVHSMNGKLSLESKPGQGVIIDIFIDDRIDGKDTGTTG